jgi:hypothetical protein
LAASIAADIKSDLGLTAQLVEGHNAIFRVAADGQILYDNNGVCGRLPENRDILNSIQSYQGDKEDKKVKTLKIEWQHLDVAGETCDRCYDTGENLAQEVKRLNRALQPRGINVEMIETKLDDTQIPQSNDILFNGVPIEDILDIEVSENYCDSCTTLLGTDTYCRMVKYEGSEYEDIPAKAIRRAAYKIMGIEEAKAPTAGSG